MEPNKMLQADFLDLLFAGRNQDYGAYALRRQYNSRMRNAIFGTATLALLLVGGYWAGTNSKAATPPADKPLAKTTVLADLDIPPAATPPPPPPPPTKSTPPPVAQTVKYVDPIVVDDALAKDEEMPPIEKIKESVVGLENLDGEQEMGNALASMLDGDNSSGVVEAPPPPKDNKTYTFVEIMPSFPGGNESLMKFLKKNMRYPVMAAENGIEGTVFVSFVVDTDGSITGVETTGVKKGGGLEEEAIRVVNKMPKWKPGMQNQQKVKVRFSMPIRFSLAR